MAHLQALLSTLCAHSSPSRKPALGDRLAESQAWYERGCRQQAEHHFAAAEQSYRRAIATAEFLGAESACGRALASLGKLHHQSGRLAPAVDCYQRSVVLLCLQARSSHEVGELLAEVYNNLGGAYQTLGHLAAALKAYRSCLELRQASGDFAGQSRVLNNLGAAAAALHRFAEAKDHYRQSLRLHRRLNDTLGAAQVWQNLALLQDKQGDRAAALRSQRKAVRLLRAVGSGPSYLMARLLLSRFRDPAP